MRIFKYITLLALAVTSVLGQLTSSTLNGNVSGPDGLVPGATVLLKNNATGKEVTVSTNSEGDYRIPNVEVGIYTLSVTVAGFKTYTATDLKIDVSKNYTLPVLLEVGGVQESVTVIAGESILNSVDAEINNTVSRRQLDDLPSLGRNPLNFVVLQPGAASNPSQNTSINGLRTSATNTTVDGINIQDNFIRSNATDFSPARPTVDEVEEFAVSSQSNADDGIGGGQIQFTTRRGGNEFHFRLFEFNRNSKLAANQFFNNIDGTPIPFRNRNQFGGNVGGPILKEKLFFFFSYEKLIDRQFAAPQFNTTLLNNARQGLFTYTAAVDDPGNGVVAGQIVTANLFNPTLGLGFTGVNPVSQSRFIASLPQGNSTQAGDQRNTTGFAVVQANNSEQLNYATRIDYLLNDKNAINGVFRFVRQDTLRPDIDNTFNQIPAATQPSINPLVSLGWTITPNSSFSNEVRGGYFNSEPIFLRSDPNPANFVTPTLITNPEVTFQNQGRIVDTVNVQDNATYSFGNHSFRFGGQFQSVKIDSFNDAGIVPTYVLGTNINTPNISTGQFTNTALFPGQVPTSQRATANQLLALLAGIVGGGSQSFNVETQESGFVSGATQKRIFDYEVYGFYFSDQWKVNGDLTLNLGLRYDLYTALNSANGLQLEPVIANIDDPLPSLLDPLGGYQFIGENIGKPGQFYNTDKNNFAPNVSFAYSPSFSGGFAKWLFGDKKSVLRGGYRTSYINDELVRAPDNALGGNQGLAFTSNVINPATGTTALNARIDAFPPVPVPVFGGPNRTYAQNNAAAGLFGTVFAVDPQIKSPLVQEYSFGITREVGFDTAVEVRYVGTSSNSLLRAIDFNQVDIRSNGFLEDFNRARSNFLLTGNAACGDTGCQPLTVFPNLGSGGLLTNSTITGQLVAGTPADLAIIYVTNGLSGSVQFLPNQNTGVVDLLSNFGEYNYNALQVDVRRRFADGFALNANYTFSKNLTNAVGTAQARFEPNLDNLQPDLENSRADFDQTHKFNVLANYELPFGKGRQYLNSGVLSTIFGNFQVGAILQIGSGAPISIVDPRGTLNRAGRAGRQTAATNLTADELRSLIGVFRTANGVFFLDPAVLGRNPDGSLQPGRDGRGVSGNFDQAPFAGQVFFRNAPGATSGLSRAIFNGPTTYNLDLSLIKRFKIGEKFNFQIQGDLFNALNTVNFIPGQFLDINTTNFGRITSSAQSRVVQLAARVNF